MRTRGAEIVRGVVIVVGAQKANSAGRGKGGELQRETVAVDSVVADGVVARPTIELEGAGSRKAKFGVRSVGKDYRQRTAEGAGSPDAWREAMVVEQVTAHADSVGAPVVDNVAETSSENQPAGAALMIVGMDSSWRWAASEEID